MKAALVLAIVAVATAAAAGGHQPAARPARGAVRPGLADELRRAPSLASTVRLPASARHASSWCGTTSATDRPPDVTGYEIHVVYAIPSDGADQSQTAAPQISDMIDALDGWWQREDPSRIPRFDTYAAPCGAQLDLTTVRLPSVSVAMTDADQIFEQLWTQFQSDPAAPYTKYLVFVDDVNTGDVCGVGATSSSSVLGQASYGVASVFLQSCGGTDLASTAGHELIHAVSPAGGFAGAPHTCPGDAYHLCDSSGDIMYPYAENGVPLSSLQLDFNHDDYWAGTAPVNLQVQPWFRHVQDQVHLALSLTGQGTVTSDLPGVNCTASCGTDWDRGDLIHLTATGAPGQRFIRWSGSCTGPGVCAVTLDSSKTVTALFAPSTYPLTVAVSGTGTVTSAPGGLTCRRGSCVKPFASYTPVVLVESPGRGSRFAGWSGACHGTRVTCSVPMTAAASVHATFKKAKKKAK